MLAFADDSALARLVIAATAIRSRGRVIAVGGGRTIEVARVRITEAGRRMLL